MIEYLIPENIVTGLYKLIAPDGFYYIGSTNNFYKRYQNHRVFLEQNKHWNPRVQAKFNKHPIGWKFVLLQEVPEEQLLNEEEVFLQCNVGEVDCMNINNRATKPPGTKGLIRSLEWRKKLSVANKNRKYLPCPQWKRKHMSQIMKQRLQEGYCPPIHTGKKRSLETRAKISQALKGKRVGIKRGPYRPRTKPTAPCSEQTKLKISSALKGRKKTLEHREAIRLANIGRVHSEETRLKMSLSRKGQKRTPEQKERMKKAWVLRKSNNKAVYCKTA